MRRKTNHNRISNSGAAMIVAILIIGIILVFTFALLLVSYTLYASQNKNAASLRCSEAANTLSLAIEQELEDENAYSNSNLWKYIRCNALQDVKTWPYYAPGVAGHGMDEAFRYMDLRPNANYDEVQGFPGSVQLCMYWTIDDKTVLDSLSATNTFLELESTKRSTAKLHIDIIAESANQSYTVKNVYKINISQLTDSDSEYKAIKKIAETKYGTTADDRPYNPQRLSVGVDTDTNTCDIKQNEKWTFELESRE